MSGYPQSLFYFMWEWQVHFRIGCQTNAEAIFKSLDAALQPYVFMVGFNTNPESNFEPICLEPEKIHYPITDFDNLQELADEIHANHERRNMFYTGEGVQEEMDQRLGAETFRLALERRLNTSQAKNSDRICFVASSVRVNDFQVFVILELNKLVYDSNLHLKVDRSHYDLHIHRSLLDAAIKEFLAEKNRNLQLPEAGKHLSGDSRSAEEILRLSARSFFYTVSVRGINFYGLHSLFDDCNRLSQHRYETTENYGHLIIAKNNHPDIEMTLELEVPFPIDHYRKTRKMLELTNDEIGVIADAHQILGLGRIMPEYDSATETIFNIHFKGIHCWDIYHAGINILQMRFGLPQFPEEVINRQKFYMQVREEFSSLADSEVENIYQLSVAATKQKKGCMLVVTDKAQEEASRFSPRCISIKPIKLNEEILLRLTSIDGGVLIDPYGMVYAKGVILDGIAGKLGDAGRGSRYNSAVAYCDHRKANQSTMVIVVSSDSMVDVIPGIIPKIRHSEITELVKFLKSLNSKDSFNRSAFYETMDLLSYKKFYLAAEDCSEINRLRQELELLDKQLNNSLWRVFDDFLPNPEMNSSYYINEN